MRKRAGTLSLIPFWLPKFSTGQCSISRPFCCKILLGSCNIAVSVANQRGQEKKKGEEEEIRGKSTSCNFSHQGLIVGNWFLRQKFCALEFYPEWAIFTKNYGDFCRDSKIHDKAGLRTINYWIKWLSSDNLRIMKTNSVTTVDHHFSSIDKVCGPMQFLLKFKSLRWGLRIKWKTKNASCKITVLCWGIVGWWKKGNMSVGFLL